MPRRLFLISGNICSDRVRLGRALQKPPITQKELANRINFMGYEDMSERQNRKKSASCMRFGAHGFSQSFECHYGMVVRRRRGLTNR